MSDRLAQLRSLADGVGDLQHGQPGDEDHCTAADVIRWAVAEIERHTQDQQPRTKEAAPMSDENERSVASDGSVAGEPVAWAALRDDGDIAWIGYTPEGAADGACGRRIVPLYRSPTLTDAEREAVEWCVEMAALHATECDEEMVALRGLLERTK